MSTPNLNMTYHVQIYVIIALSYEHTTRACMLLLDQLWPGLLACACEPKQASSAPLLSGRVSGNTPETHQHPIQEIPSILINCMKRNKLYVLETTVNEI